MTWVAGVFDHFQGLPLTPPGIEILDGRKLGPGDVLGRTHYPLQWLAVGGRAVAIPGSDATSQDALDGAAVEPFDDLRTHNKSFQSPEGEQVLSCPLHNCLRVLGPCLFVGDVDSKELEALNLLHCCPIDENGGVLSPLFLQSTIISFVLVTLRERLLSWHHTARSPTSP